MLARELDNIVCGSTEHPCIAHKQDEAPTKEEREEAESKANVAKDEAAAASTAANTAKTRCDEKLSAATQKAHDLSLEGDIDEIETKISAKKKEINRIVKEAIIKIEAADKKIKRKEEIGIIIPGKEKKLETFRKSIGDKEVELTEKQAQKAATEKRLSEIKQKLRFDSTENLHEEINKLETSKAQAEAEISAAETNFRKSEKTVIALKAAIKESEKQLENKPDINVAAENELHQQLNEKKNEYSKILKTIFSRKSNNEDILGKICSRISEITDVDRKRQWIKALSDTANGNIPGKEKIMLETYIQMTYFDRIIARANTRFMIMSDGQYELKRRASADNNRSQSGLDLDVIDHYNGSERSVNTLSGGESFKASLSLALGLSDEIQSSAGGIKLDTMFVDEGFGSLDEESLQQAMKALINLTEGDRLVGIISHVSELKERIDKQIIVTKEKSGGSKVEIVV